jgi:hypothetical protein
LVLHARLQQGHAGPHRIGAAAVGVEKRDGHVLGGRCTFIVTAAIAGRSHENVFSKGDYLNRPGVRPFHNHLAGSMRQAQVQVPDHSKGRLGSAENTLPKSPL